MVMTRVTWRRELAWAIGLLGLAVILGFMFHWPLVQASLRGNLTACCLTRSARNGGKCNSRE